jgi:hypothetical protein
MVATQAPAVTPQPVQRSGLPVEVWCVAGIVLMCAGIGAGMKMVSKWRK